MLKELSSEYNIRKNGIQYLIKLIDLHGGSLFIGTGDHLFNTVATNTLHIVTSTGADELQITSILQAQVISFILVIVGYNVKIKNKVFDKL